MVCHLAGVFFAVRAGAEEATLFTHPRHDSDRALWPNPLVVEEVSGCQSNCNARAIIECPCSEVPRIEMS